MPEKDKFKLVNHKEEESFLIEDEEPKKPEEKEESKKIKNPEEIKKEKRKKLTKKLLITSLVMFLISAAFFGLGILWQWKWDKKAVTNALTLAFVLVFFAGWIMLMWNLNIISPLIYGIKTFGRMIIGKRPKTDYHTYMAKIEDDPIPKYYILTCFITSGILFIPLLVLLLI